MNKNLKSEERFRGYQRNGFIFYFLVSCSLFLISMRLPSKGLALCGRRFSPYLLRQASLRRPSRTGGVRIPILTPPYPAASRPI